MSDSIEFTRLMADASARGGGIRLAETLRTAFIESDPDDVAMTAETDGHRRAITSSGKPMTVCQVQAELQILLVGE